MISDGTSNTYMVGEKYAVPNFYATGTDPSDAECYFSGDDDDNQRTGWSAPMPDTPDFFPGTGATTANFGSAHETGVNMAFCDGSVHTISYTINSNAPSSVNRSLTTDPANPPGVHQRLANRQDGWSVDAGQF